MRKVMVKKARAQTTIFISFGFILLFFPRLSTYPRPLSFSPLPTLSAIMLPLNFSFADVGWAGPAVNFGAPMATAASQSGSPFKCVHFPMDGVWLTNQSLRDRMHIFCSGSLPVLLPHGRSYFRLPNVLVLHFIAHSFESFDDNIISLNMDASVCVPNTIFCFFALFLLRHLSSFVT